MVVHVLVPVSGSLSLRMVPRTQICASWWLLSWDFAHSRGLVCAKVLKQMCAQASGIPGCQIPDPKGPFSHLGSIDQFCGLMLSFPATFQVSTDWV